MATSALATAFVNIVPGTVELERYLKGELENQAEKAGVSAGEKLTEGLSKGLKDAGAKMTDIGKKLSLSVTAPLTAIGIKSIATSAEFGVAMASLQVNSGASAESIEELRELAIKMGADTVFSAGEAANAMLELSKGGMDPATISGGALEATMALAATEGMALADAATIVTQAMNTFSFSAEDSMVAVDLLAAGAVASTAGVYDLAGAMKFVGSTANSLGVPMSDTVTALAALNNAGIDSTTAGTSLNRMMLGLIPTTRKAQTAMDELGVSFINEDGTVKSMAEVIDILSTSMAGLTDAERVAELKNMFGVEGMRAATILLAEGADGWNALNAQVTQGGVASELSNARMSGLAGAIEQMKGSIDTAFLTVGDRLSPAITAITGFFTSFINGFAALTPQTQTVIVTVAAVVAAVGPLLIVAGQLTSAIGTMIPVVVKLWGVMAANPIGVLITAIALVVAGLVYFFTQTELGKEIWQNFVTFLGDAWNWLYNDILKPVFDAIGAAFNFLYTNVIAPVMSAIFLIIGIWAALWVALFEFAIKPVLDKIALALNFLAQNVLVPVGEFFKGVFTTIGVAAQVAWEDFIKPALDAIGTAFKWVYDNIIKPIGAFIEDVVNSVGETFRSIFQGVSDFMVSIFNGLVDIVRVPLNKIIGFINRVISALNTIKVEIPDWVPQWGGRTFGINIPRIPALAEGGYVDRPTYALIGEAGPEVVTPLKDFERMMGMGNGSGSTINYYAAPNQSLDAEQALFQAMKRAKVVAAW